MTKSINGFSKLSKAEKLEWLGETYADNAADFVQEMKAANARQTKSREHSDNESRTTRVLR